MKTKLLFALATILLITSCVDQNESAHKLLDEGTKLFQEGNYDASIQKYNEALKIEPNNSVAYNLLGMAYRFKFNQTGTQEFKTKEIESFKEAVDLDPKYWIAYKNLAASLYYQDRKKEAVPYLEKALELQPNDPEKSILLQWIEEGKK
jgi:tetratricopeptide (TPR) repeat protein